MKTTFAVSMAVAAVIASSSFASAATIHRPAADAYAAANGQYYGQNYGQQYQQPQTAVTLGNRVVGQDPDANIRAQLERDPVPTEY